MRLEDLMERAAQYDENLARDIKDYVHGRKYGLVYEASKPEFVRMWKKPVVRGDIVNILPPRGVMEDTKNEDDPSEIVYKVIAISEGVATLRNEKTGETVTASVDDIVALARFDKPIYAGLKEIGRVERGGDKPYHVVINGENYHALQTLVYAYQGQVDCIYIDPPYNTGATDWKYNNNYVGKDDKYRHSKWLTFMEDRLRLAKKLLNPKDSVLIVTIDEKEYLRLGLLLEQLFPEARIQMVSTLTNSRGVARENGFARVDEYIYIVQFGDSSVSRLPLSDEWRVNIKEDKRVTHLRWSMLIRSGSHFLRSDSVNQFYPVFINNDGKSIHSVGEPYYGDNRNEIITPKGTFAVWPLRKDGNEGNWQISNTNLRKLIASGFVMLGRLSKGTVPIYYLKKGEIAKVYNGTYKICGHRADGSIISETEVRSLVTGTQWRIGSHDASIGGTSLLKGIFGASPFTYPKSLYAVHDTLRFFVNDKPNALVIDFFGGSGTTLHAVNLLNAEDQGHRKCILVTNNEISEDEEISLTAQGLRPTDQKWDDLGIARYVTWPRTVCSIEGHDIKRKPLKGNYGCPIETYQGYDGYIVDPETGKKKRKKLFEKVKKPFYPELADHKMSDGFEENAIFFDLEYLEPSVVSADLAFDRIAPILWLAGGCKGEILQRQKGYVIGETYAVLFDPRYTTRFVDAVSENKEIKTVFIVTDAAERYRSLCAELPGCRVMQLYESYLRSFEINAIG